MTNAVNLASLAISGALSADSSGNVGLGVTPSAWRDVDDVLQVGQGFFGGLATSSSTRRSYMGSNYYTNSSGQDIYIANGEASLYQQNNGSHILYSAVSGTAGNVATLTSILDVRLGSTLTLQGGATSSGTGITFPATQNASSNANTLDDYEEGTFTPSYGGTTTAGTTTYTLRDGYYTKVGRLVTFVINLGWSNATGTGAGLISGLPFTSSSASQNYTPVVIRSDGYAQAGGQIEGYVNINDTLIFLEQANLTTGVITQLAMDTVVGRIMIAGSYFVA